MNACSRRQQVWLLLAVVIGVAVPIRLYLASNAAMISRDGVQYIWYAQNLRTQPLAEMREQKQPPGYPALILASHGILTALAPVLPDSVANDPVIHWQTAAMSVTFVGALAVVVAVYGLARRLFDPLTAVVAALMTATAAEFCQLSADALTDMPHLALYLSALIVAIEAVRRESLGRFALAGFLSGLAYLLRPEGAEVAVVTAVLLLVPGVVRSWRFRLAALALLMVASLMPAAPYMLVTGKLIHKKSLGQMLGVPTTQMLPAAGFSRDDNAIPPFRADGDRTVDAAHGFAESHREWAMAGVSSRLIRAMGVVGEHYARSLRVTFLLPALLWLAWRRRKPADAIAQRFVIAALLLHWLIVVRLPLAYDEYFDLFSTRHVIILAALTLPFAAAGVQLATGHLAARLLRKRSNASETPTCPVPDVPLPNSRPVAVIRGIILILLIAPTLGYLLEHPHHESGYIRRAGQWIREQNIAHPRILTTRYPVAFYANTVAIPAPSQDDVGEFLDHARWQRPDYLVFEEKRCRKIRPDFFEQLLHHLRAGENLDLVHVESARPGEKSDRVLIYRYRPPVDVSVTGVTSKLKW